MVTPHKEAGKKYGKHIHMLPSGRFRVRVTTHVPGSNREEVLSAITNGLAEANRKKREFQLIVSNMDRIIKEVKKKDIIAGIYDEGYGRLRYMVYVNDKPVNWFETLPQATRALGKALRKH